MFNPGSDLTEDLIWTQCKFANFFFFCKCFLYLFFLLIFSKGQTIKNLCSAFILALCANENPEFLGALLTIACMFIMPHNYANLSRNQNTSTTFPLLVGKRLSCCCSPSCPMCETHTLVLYVNETASCQFEIYHLIQKSLLNN